MTLLIALPFLLSAITKSIDSGRFFRQISRISLFPKTFIPFITPFTIGIIWFVSTALILQSCLSLTRILIQGFLTIGILATLIQWIQQKRPSCECYGPALPVSPPMSITIDIAILWSTTHLVTDECTHTDIKKILMGVVFGVILARISSRKPILDLSKTGLGKRWTLTPSEKENFFVAFLSSECPICAEWLPILYACSKHHSVQIISATKPDFLPDSIHFIQRDRKNILRDIEHFPLVLWVKEEVIIKKWEEKPPQNLLEQINTTH